MTVLVFYQVFSVQQLWHFYWLLASGEEMPEKSFLEN